MIRMIRPRKQRWLGPTAPPDHRVLPHGAVRMLSEVGEILGLSEKTVWKIEQQALAKLWDGIQEMEASGDVAFRLLEDAIRGRERMTATEAKVSA